MKYNALRVLCDAKDNIDIKDFNLQRQKNGRLYKFSCFWFSRGFCSFLSQFVTF